jgi:hypothetical protein
MNAREDAIPACGHPARRPTLLIAELRARRLHAAIFLLIPESRADKEFEQE